MPKLHEVTNRPFESFPQIKAAELQEVRFTIVNARGPYRTKDGTGDFIVFAVALEETGEMRDLLLSNKGSARADILAHFIGGETEPIGPVTIRPLDTGKAVPMWNFVDPDEDPAGEPEPENGKGKGKGK